ncbi:hypothetical protein LCGC14_1518540 [marine sediment metagenome]|uniref:Uncharacterized protein n=1 Tax=marine sediment metagenome TaxID=412755 RepID=A0A0F9JK53_9ZZZZ|nr:hypothetical protein [bacterium]
MEYIPSLSKSSAQPYSGSTVNQWITKADFKNIFPDSLKFSFTFYPPSGASQQMSMSLYEMWNTLYGLNFNFDATLFELNRKIQVFKDSMAGGTPYITYLNAELPIFSGAYLNLAESMATLLLNLHDNNLFTGPHSIFDMLSPDQITLLRLIFGL